MLFYCYFCSLDKLLFFFLQSIFTFLVPSVSSDASKMFCVTLLISMSALMLFSSIFCSIRVLYNTLLLLLSKYSIFGFCIHIRWDFYILLIHPILLILIDFKNARTSVSTITIQTFYQQMFHLYFLIFFFRILGCTLKTTNGTNGANTPVILNAGHELTLAIPQKGSINFNTSTNLILVCPGPKNKIVHGK